MRPSLVFCLLILSFLLAKAQGIRLEKGSLLAVQQQKQHGEESTLKERSSNEAEEAILCKDEQCKGKVKNRKLVVTTSLKLSSKNNEKKEGDIEAHYSSVNGNTSRKVKPEGKEEEGIKVQTQTQALATSSESRELHHEQYPDLVDIAEMDYSPARRKPPIHN